MHIKIRKLKNYEVYAHKNYEVYTSGNYDVVITIFSYERNDRVFQGHFTFYL